MIRFSLMMEDSKISLYLPPRMYTLYWLPLPLASRIAHYFYRGLTEKGVQLIMGRLVFSIRRWRQ